MYDHNVINFEQNHAEINLMRKETQVKWDVFLILKKKRKMREVVA